MTTKEKIGKFLEDASWKLPCITIYQVLCSKRSSLPGDIAAALDVEGTKRLKVLRVLQCMYDNVHHVGAGCLATYVSDPNLTIHLGVSERVAIITCKLGCDTFDEITYSRDLKKWKEVYGDVDNNL